MVAPRRPPHATSRFDAPLVTTLFRPVSLTEMRMVQSWLQLIGVLELCCLKSRIVSSRVVYLAL